MILIDFMKTMIPHPNPNLTQPLRKRGNKGEGENHSPHSIQIPPLLWRGQGEYHSSDKVKIIIY